VWKINLGRNRSRWDKFAPAAAFTMDGISYADSTKFRPLKMVK